MHGFDEMYDKRRERRGGRSDYKRYDQWLKEEPPRSCGRAARKRK